uniref:Uncharacterized protein n=1 Tax=Cacopsylla melanoneura TaxID=428564 RepID=A0A8D8R118_9HEMI
MTEWLVLTYSLTRISSNMLTLRRLLALNRRSSSPMYGMLWQSQSGSLLRTQGKPRPCTMEPASSSWYTSKGPMLTSSNSYSVNSWTQAEWIYHEQQPLNLPD